MRGLLFQEPDFHISDDEDDFGGEDTHFLDDSKGSSVLYR